MGSKKTVNFFIFKRQILWRKMSVVIGIKAETKNWKTILMTEKYIETLMCTVPISIGRQFSVIEKFHSNDS